MVGTPPPGSSTVLIDEYFESGDDRFLAEVLGSRSDKKLLALADKWFWDPRPFARRMLVAYIDDGCDRPNHRVLVKRFFKAAESAGDDELMGHFLAAFDRLVRHELVPRRTYDWTTREYVTDWVLRPDTSVASRLPKKKPGQRPPAAERFTRRTRLYLCRRAFRYFRNLGRRDRARYTAAMREALPLYRDEHLQKPEQLLDAWGLVHVLYHGSPVLERNPHGVRLARGARLADLAPAPLYLDAWRQAFDVLLALVDRARCRTVRLFALALLEAHHGESLRALPLARLRALLKSPHPEVQALAARRLKDAAGLENLPLGDWLDLLTIDNAEIIPLLCALVRTHVHPDRLTLAQAVDLARSAVAAVAELGLSWAQQKPVRDRADFDAVVPLRDAPVARVREAGMAWVAGLLAESPLTTPEMVRDLIDSRYAETRAAGLGLMERRFAQETSLWSALSESPYDDVRERFVRHLATWEAELDPESLQRVWATALLAIHRGGRTKQRVVKQVADRIVRHPEAADDLLPLLGVALRSVRAPERRAGLAAVAQAAFRVPSLRAAVERRLPELRLHDMGTA